MNQTFASFLKEQIAGRQQKDVAASMGITPAQLSKILQGQPCERNTVAKIIVGISDDIRIQALGLCALLEDLKLQGGEASRLVKISVRKK